MSDSIKIVELKPTKWHKIDTEKVKSLNDVLQIIAGINLQVRENSPEFDLLKKFLKDE